MSILDRAQTTTLSQQEKAKQVAAQIEAKRVLVANLQQQVTDLKASESSLQQQAQTLTQEKEQLTTDLGIQKDLVTTKNGSINQLTGQNGHLSHELDTANQNITELQQQVTDLTQERDDAIQENARLTGELQTANGNVESGREANRQLREKYEAVQSLDLSLTKFEESLQSINQNILSIVSSDNESVCKYLELSEGTPIDDEYNQLVFSGITNINQVPEVLKSLFIENGFNSESLNLAGLVQLRESLRESLQKISGVENLKDVKDSTPYLEKKLELYNAISEVLDKLMPNEE